MFDNFFIVLLVIVFIIFLLITFLVIRSKDLFTRVLLLNITTSVAILFICIFGVFKFNSSYIDIALIYAFLGVISSTAYLKYFIKNFIKNDDSSQIVTYATDHVSKVIDK